MALPEPAQMDNESLLDELCDTYEELQSLDIELREIYADSGRESRILLSLEYNEKRYGALRAEALTRMKN